MQHDAIVVAANFTAEPIQDSMAFWMEQLRLPLAVEFAPHDQAFQQLLDPTSRFHRNPSGVNVLLLRLDGWATHAQDALPDPAQLRQNVHEIVAAVRGARERHATPYIVVRCPAPPALRFHPVAGASLRAAEALAHIPYTEPYFAALGAMIARRVRAAKAAPYKVLAVDCDNTLWGGVCGELGATGVDIDEARRALQTFLVQQYEAGMLICLCSKNNRADVDEVFAIRTEMPLRPEHVVASRINWEPKSANLRALAAELNLGLDSFIFLDDSPFEIQEVQANCPEVLALQVPMEPTAIHAFIRHCWAFDHLTVTAADRQRSESYRRDLQRGAVLKAAGSLEEFLESLQLDVTITPPATPEEFSRAAQMTQRTNQFNATTIRRTDTELRHACEDGTYLARQVHVRDRFGDYGIVGLMLFDLDGGALRVGTFLLSCRALGRRVEHRMLAELGRIAQQAGAATVALQFVATPKNAPARTFLESLGASASIDGGAGVFRLSPAAAAAAPELPFAAASAPATASPSASTSPASGLGRAADAALLARICQELATADGMVDAIAASRQRARPAAAGTVAAPRTDAERIVVDIWRQVLRLDAVGVDDNFFDLGGDSLTAVAMCARLQRAFGQPVAPTALLQAPTAAMLAAMVSADAAAPSHDTALTSLVPLQRAGARPPLFCVHAGAGSVLFYYPLARRLAPAIPVYALQAQGLYGRARPHATIDAMAAHYISEMRTVQPSGPYQIAGFCLGAILAFEVAQQLGAAGETVAFLGSFDGIAPGYASAPGRAELRQRPVRRQREHLPAWAGWLPDSIGRGLVLRFDAMAELPPRRWPGFLLGEAADVLQRRSRRAGQRLVNRTMAAYTGRTGGPVPPVLRRLPWYFQVNHMLAKRRYHPRRYAGTMHVFTIAGRYPDARLGWDRWVGGGVTTHQVSGVFRQHRDLMDEPMVAQVAEELEGLLAGVADRPVVGTIAHETIDAAATPPSGSAAPQA